jgi:hypothetical protein
VADAVPGLFAVMIWVKRTVAALRAVALGLGLDRPRAPSNRSEAVGDETTWPMRRLRFV